MEKEDGRDNFGCPRGTGENNMSKLFRTLGCGIIGAIGGLAYHIRHWGIFVLAIVLLFVFIFYSWLRDNGY